MQYFDTIFHLHVHLVFLLRKIGARIFLHFINNNDPLTMCLLQTFTFTAAFQSNPVTNYMLIYPDISSKLTVASIDNNIVVHITIRSMFCLFIEI